MTTNQRREFAERFPEGERCLTSHYFTLGGRVYLDYGVLGVWNDFGGNSAGEGVRSCWKTTSIPLLDLA